MAGVVSCRPYVAGRSINKGVSGLRLRYGSYSFTVGYFAVLCCPIEDNGFLEDLMP